MARTKTCPDCGGVMRRETGRIAEPKAPIISGYPLRDAIVETRYVERPANFYACTACEHCEETK